MSDTHPSIADHVQSVARRRRLALVAVPVAVVLVAGAVLTYLFTRPSASATTADVISLTIADTKQSDFQDKVIEVAREKGIELSFVNFDDPYLPNTALVDGQVDGNSFQHVAWLSQFNAKNNTDITPVFSTVVSQWGLFSATHATAADIPDGARIAVPDDVSNFARSLFILQGAGLLDVADDAGVFPDEEDITSNPKNLELVRIAHESVQTGYDDPTIDGVVIALDDFDPAKNITAEDALFLEDGSAPSAAPYVIVVATLASRADDPVWDTLEEVYRDPRVVEAHATEKRGLEAIAEVPVETLRTALAELEAQAA